MGGEYKSNKGLEVYTNMPLNEIDNYKELNKTLLRRYELTEEGFSMRFREEKPDEG